MDKIIRSKYFIIFFCLIISCIGITICSECSFLYPMNYWVDANAFFTVGKSMLHGLVPYLDLFEQKGPILYFIYMIGAFISEKSFIGVYSLEIISYSITLYYLSKVIRLYLDGTPQQLISTSASISTSFTSVSSLTSWHSSSPFIIT